MDNNGMNTSPKREKVAFLLSINNNGEVVKVKTPDGKERELGEFPLENVEVDNMFAGPAMLRTKSGSIGTAAQQNCCWIWTIKGWCCIPWG